MFTGIVQALGRVRSLEHGVLKLSAPSSLAPNGFDHGESLAVNGCCLTVVESGEPQAIPGTSGEPQAVAAGPALRSGEPQADPDRRNRLLQFDISPETLARTSLGALAEGSVVNLERPMSAEGRFGGHIVQGHVDTTGSIVSITPTGNAVVYRFQAPIEYDRYLIDKGSVTVDGISLTVVEPSQGQFDVWVIPHTLHETNLSTLNVGSRVNLEFDVIARYVEKLMQAAIPSKLV